MTVWTILCSFYFMPLLLNSPFYHRGRGHHMVLLWVNIQLDRVHLCPGCMAWGHNYFYYIVWITILPWTFLTPLQIACTLFFPSLWGMRNYFFHSFNIAKSATFFANFPVNKHPSTRELFVRQYPEGVQPIKGNFCGPILYTLSPDHQRVKRKWILVIILMQGKSAAMWRHWRLWDHTEERLGLYYPYLRSSLHAGILGRPLQVWPRKVVIWFYSLTEMCNACFNTTPFGV